MQNPLVDLGTRTEHGSSSMQPRTVFVRYHHSGTETSTSDRSRGSANQFKLSHKTACKLSAALAKVNPKNSEEAIAGMADVITALIEAVDEIPHALRKAFVRDFAELLFRYAEHDDEKIALMAARTLVLLEGFARERGVAIGASITVGSYIDTLFLYDVHPAVTKEISNYFVEMANQPEGERGDLVRCLFISRVGQIMANIMNSGIPNYFAFAEAKRCLDCMGVNQKGLLVMPKCFRDLYANPAELEKKIAAQSTDMEKARAGLRAKAADGREELLGNRCKELESCIGQNVDAGS
jgi:hypothetical protein